MGKNRDRTVRAALTIMVAAQLVIACTATPSGSPGASGSTSPSATSIAIPRGGTLRVVMPVERAPRFSVLRAVPPIPAVLDPQKEFLDGFLLLRCCLTRTLLSHNGLSSEEGGSRLRPDLATALPDIGSDGVTWTFHLKEGIQYGPPLGDVEITAQDFVRAFHRLFTPAVIDVGPFLFGDIEGAADYAAGKAASISGLEVPDPHTLVIRLTRPAGDLGARLAMSLVSPLPPNPSDPAAPFGVAQGHDDGYGRFLVSTGPYMVEGSEKLDFSLAPDAQKPASGVVLGKSIVLVRNPNWDPSSDDLRMGYVDRIELSIGGSIDAALASFDAGNVDVVWNHNAAPVYTPEQIAPYLAGERNGRVVIDDYDASRGLFLNLAIAPFDDVHVRKAANFAVNKARLVELTGGSAAAEVAGHLVTDSLLDNLLVDYDPYATPGSAGDLEAAKTEMRQSRYDSNGDGKCDAGACASVEAVTRGGPYERIGNEVRDDLAGLGLDVHVEVLEQDPFFDSFYDPATRSAIFIGLGWTKSFMSASSFFLEQFYSPTSLGPEFTNGTLVGASPELLATWGYDPVEVPNIDARIEACLPLIGAAQFECWASLDQYVTEEVVPLVPYVFDKYPSVLSSRVVNYAFDQLWAGPAWDRLAVSE